MANVHIRDLVKRYDQVTAVKQVTVEIPEGSLTAFLGPSGCGKTTLLRCIAGLLMPDEGQISIGDKDVTHMPAFKRNLGMVFQRPSMFPHLTAYDNVAWGLQLRRWPKNDIPKRVSEMLKLVHLEGMEQRAFRQLSGGQAQRVVIARALAPAPDILLLDEPLSALDAKLRDELIWEIADIHRKTGCTTLLVTHDQGEALTIADNVLLMNDGKIEQEGTPLDVYRNPRTLFSATFIGTNNFLPGTVREIGAGILVEIEGIGMTLQAERGSVDHSRNAPVWVCVRADDIDVIPSGESSNFRNVITVNVERASLTGGFVIIEGKLNSHALRIHVGGGQRFDLLSAVGKTITCGLSNIALIPRENTADTAISSLQQSLSQ